MKFGFLFSGATAVKRCVPESPIVDAAAAKLVDDSFFTVLVANFAKHEVKKNFLDKAQIEKRFVKTAEDVAEKKIKVEEGIPTRNIDLARSLSPR